MGGSYVLKFFLLIAESVETATLTTHYLTDLTLTNEPQPEIINHIL